MLPMIKCNEYLFKFKPDDFTDISNREFKIIFFISNSDYHNI